MDVLRHWGKGGHVDLVAGIAYYHVLTSRGRMWELTHTPPKLLFARDFSSTTPRIVKIWRGFRSRVLHCVFGDFTKVDGDFEMPVAKRHIRDSAAGRALGVEGRCVPSDVIASYLGVVLLGTKTVEDIIEYLDGLHDVLHVGVEKGRRRAVVVGDQETFTLVHKVKKLHKDKYAWVVPWIGDWHLLEHTLDVLFRKWGGFALIPLAKAADCYDKKLEGKNYHKRHNFFVGFLEALWRACIGEVKETPQSGGMRLSDEELLANLLGYRDNQTKHKTFGQWADFLLSDGMAYLAVYIGIRTGDFDLREAAIRKIAPLFLGYNKNLCHALCIQHLADIARLSPAERLFISETFSLSRSGKPGKNTGLDEIQEMTMNKDIKQAATGTDVRYLQRLNLTLQTLPTVAREVKEMYGSSVIYNRKIYASDHRRKIVDKIHASLVAEGSPFKLRDEKGAQSIISADGRVALAHLESTMMEAGSKSVDMCRRGVLETFEEELGPGGQAKDAARKRVKLATFNTGTEKKTKTRAQGAAPTHIEDLQKAIGALAKGKGKMALGVPAQLCSLAGVPHKTSKSKTLDIVVKHAKGASGKKSRTGDSFFDKPQLVPTPKSFASVTRGQSAGASAGAKRKNHKLHSKKKPRAPPQPPFTKAPTGFEIRDKTPEAAEWQTFLEDRQHRDGVFSVLCKFIRHQYDTIRKKTSDGVGLEYGESCLQRLQLEVDGESVLSSDCSRTESYLSWYNTKELDIVLLEANGIGEGGGVEVVSVDTDVWMAALLAYAVHPSTRDVRIMCDNRAG
ncbi:unnamed protein product [Ectocarpus sp. CCAP 1310/34]|nr:unnamed protein product [Ectocarpus sp. CCAP 1310/34]